MAPLNEALLIDIGAPQGADEHGSLIAWCTLPAGTGTPTPLSIHSPIYFRFVESCAHWGFPEPLPPLCPLSNPPLPPFKILAAMGGGRHFHYPKYVWSPSGGWWSNPANWKANTAVALAGVAITALGVFTLSAAREVGGRIPLGDRCRPLWPES